MSFDTALILLGLKGLEYYEMLWMMIGLLGQLIFFSRWVIQWIVSEKYSKSIIPTAFWWCSLCGGLITFTYAYHIRSFPFMLAQFVGIIVYLRNIYFNIIVKK